MQTFATAAPITALVDVPAGNLRFIAADRADATVEVRPATPGKSRDVKAAEGTAVTFADGDITIGRLNGSAELTTARGDLTITEAVTGTVVLTTQAGSVSVGAARGADATLDAGTSYGRVHNTLRNTQGKGAPLTIRATTSYGDISAHSH